MKVGKNIETLRKRAGLSQNALAKASGLSRMSIVRYETGERSPTIANLEKVASALCIPVKELLFIDAEVRE